MNKKEKIIEILDRHLKDKGKLPEFYADQILEIRLIPAEKEVLEEIRNLDWNYIGQMTEDSLLRYWGEKIRFWQEKLKK